jgi:hypothetical protein
MFVVDGSDWCARDGGAHRIFSDANKSSSGPIREILVAGGDDLQERKRLLVDKADALVVLPGGPGTWDEVGFDYVCRTMFGILLLTRSTLLHLDDYNNIHHIHYSNTPVL